ncbi:lipolytic protein G-D-S-L family [Clostridium sp. ZBS4]|uniref:lipolytic protein G-D-S-L family n=1 Tax=Clostridium sp. ZBS4 TaxID=2949974 RepID=UPI00207AF311|nr:lipolytic protein G-D-S-L family [Clostridium sp. ZBS4]
MHNSKVKWLKAIIFLIIFIMINSMLVFIIVPKGNYSRMTIREMHAQSKNIDVAFIGASLSQKDINPYIMDKELGCNTFDYAFSGQSYAGTYYSLKELFNYHNPKLVILTTDQANYTCKEERTIAYLSVALYIESFWNKIQYYCTSTKDGSYLDRLFAWRGYHVKSIPNAINNIYGKLDPSYIYYPQTGQVESYSKNNVGYIGKGAEIIDPNDPKTINYDKLGKTDQYSIDMNNIQEENVEYLRSISKLCKENDCKLILLNTPFPTYEVFRIKDFFEFHNEVAKIAKELEIEYYDCTLIKPELFKSEENYFFDRIHFNSNGQEVFSKSLADFLKLREKGEDMNKYFYTPEEYYASINYITNTWFTWKKDNDKLSLVADAFYGTNVVPEYQFILIDSQTGKEEIIREYNTNPEFTFKKLSLSKYKIRVNAREVGSNNEFKHYYEEEFGAK